MKNINKYRTPQEKLAAWVKWRCSKLGCAACGVECPFSKSMCFNAWLHSTTEKIKDDKNV